MNETEFEAQTLQLLKARGVGENRLWGYQAALGEKEAVISSLLPCLEYRDYMVPYLAASALGNLGNASESVISALLLRLEHRDNSVRSQAAETLGKLGNASETVINALLLRLEDEDNSVR